LLLAVLFGGMAQTAVPGVAVDGVVLDQTGAVLAGATVELVNAAGAVTKTVDADAVGTFRFDAVPPGTYQLRATFEGFKPASARVRVGARPPSRQKLVLELASISQEITVSDSATEMNTTASSNVDAVSIDQNMLDSLPVFDRDYIATVSRFLDTGSLGTGGVTVVVNGMEVNALNVSASAVAQIRINQDPYSAEYSRPGRGRIEILTKPGTQTFHAETNAIVRDARFNARNAFATSKPPEQRRIFEGFLGGPVGKGGKTSFMLSANDERNDNQAFIFAVGPSGVIDDTLPQSSGEARSPAAPDQRQEHVLDPTKLSIQSDENRGAAARRRLRRHYVHITSSRSPSRSRPTRSTLVVQFQMLRARARADDQPPGSRHRRRRRVYGRRRAGRHHAHGNAHQLERARRGVTARISSRRDSSVDWSTRFLRPDYRGTFFLPGSMRPAHRTPSQQRGNGDLALLEKQVGAYIKDDWHVRPGLSIGYGLRYDWQNYFHDNNNVAPRVSLAYAPGNKKTNVFRAGVGVFNDRSGPVVIADVLHSLPGGLTRLVVTNPGYPDPFASAAVAAAQPPSIVQLAPDVQIPQTIQYSAGLEHQLQKTTTLSITYTGARGYHLFRSRDINAPPPPLYLARPALAFGAIRQVESNGRQDSDSLAVTLRGRVTRWFNGQVQYTLSRVDNDANGIGSFAANDYDLSGEWARADFDRRHRFVLLGRVSPVKAVNLGVGLTLNSGGPFTEMLGGDVYNNGRGRARPAGVGRNTREGDGFATLDLRASRDVKFGTGKDERAVTFGLDAFNLLNRVNYGGYVGTVSSPLFGLPVSARPPRQLQFSTRLKF
jgi:hypothetical protein